MIGIFALDFVRVHAAAPFGWSLFLLVIWYLWNDLSYVFASLQTKPKTTSIDYQRDIEPVKDISGSFDIHVTVDERQLYRFKLFCSEFKIEPTYVAALDDKRFVCHQQLMTSEHTAQVGLNAAAAIQKAISLAHRLEQHDIRVHRIKVEARAESKGVDEFLQTQRYRDRPDIHYFEFHFKLVNTTQNSMGAMHLHNVCKKYSLSCATNLFGKNSQALFQPFIAYRIRCASIQKALKACTTLIETLRTKENLTVIEEHIHKEFVVFDTHPAFDDGFVPAAQEL